MKVGKKEVQVFKKVEVDLEESTDLVDLDDYIEIYEQNYNDKISRKEMIRLVLKSFFVNDRDLKAHRKQKMSG